MGNITKKRRVPGRAWKALFSTKKPAGAGLRGSMAVFLKIVDRVLDSFFCVTDLLLGFSLDLFRKAFGFLLSIAGQFSGPFLDLSGDVFRSAFHLIFVHDQSPLQKIRVSTLLASLCPRQSTNV
jgi:hypothetical protein